MVLSLSGLELMKRFEGCRLAAYEDVRGIWTIGYGHTAGVSPGQTCTQKQAEAWLAEDARWAEEAVGADVHVPLTQNMFDALVDFVYNVGSGNFKASRLLALLNARAYLSASLEFPKWAHAGAAIVPGLLLRRQAEASLFNTP